MPMNTSSSSLYKNLVNLPLFLVIQLHLLKPWSSQLMGSKLFTWLLVVLATGCSLLEGVGVMMSWSADEIVCSSVGEESVNESLELCERVKESEDKDRSELVLWIPTG